MRKNTIESLEVLKLFNRKDDNYNYNNIDRKLFSDSPGNYNHNNEQPDFRRMNENTQPAISKKTFSV